MTTHTRKSLAKAYLSVVETKGRPHAVKALAAALISERRIQDLNLIIREIGKELLLTKGELHAQVETAHELTAGIKKSIASFLKSHNEATSTVITYTINPHLQGGIVIKTPAGELDASVSRSISTLKHLF